MCLNSSLSCYYSLEDIILEKICPLPLPWACQAPIFCPQHQPKNAAQFLLYGRRPKKHARRLFLYRFCSTKGCQSLIQHYLGKFGVAHEDLKEQESFWSPRSNLKAEAKICTWSSCFRSSQTITRKQLSLSKLLTSLITFLLIKVCSTHASSI